MGVNVRCREGKRKRAGVDRGSNRTALARRSFAGRLGHFADFARGCRIKFARALTRGFVVLAGAVAHEAQHGVATRLEVEPRNLALPALEYGGLAVAAQRSRRSLEDLDVDSFQVVTKGGGCPIPFSENPSAGSGPEFNCEDWSVTFATDDADATAAKATQLGGKVIVPPFDAPWVRMTVIADAQGATFIASKFVPENRDLAGQADATASAA